MLKCEGIWYDKLNIYNPYNDPWSEKLSKMKRGHAKYK
jgi:hypothetical protein